MLWTCAPTVARPREVSARIKLDGAAKANDFYCSVLFTGPHSQLTIMSLSPSEEIGLVVRDVDQFMYVVQGEGLCLFGSEEANLAKGDVVCVTAGVPLNIINGDDTAMKLVIFYARPQHTDHLVQRWRG